MSGHLFSPNFRPFSILKMRNKMSMKRKRVLETCTRRKKQPLKDGQNDNCNWARLLDYLLELVIEKLPLVDCLSFSRVCKPWKSVTTKLFDGCSRGIPLLVKPGQSENLTRMCLNVLDQNKNLSLNILMRGYSRRYIWGSYHDWLILASYFQSHIHLALYNPFSGEEVVLPETCDSYHMVVLSSVPSDPRCIFMLVHNRQGVAFWTAGAQAWHKCDFMGHEGDFTGTEVVADALHHEGNFYLLRRGYEMVIIDEKEVRDMLNSDSSYSSRIATQYIGLEVPCEEISHNTRKYLVESSGDIVLICRIFYEGGPEVHKTFDVETFRLDVSQKAWVKLESLGDKTVFLGRSSSRSFHAKMELGNHALANNIYFSNSCSTFGVNQWESVCKYFEERNDVDDWCAFSLGHKESSDLPRAFDAPGKHWPGTWVTAPFWWCLRQPLKHL